MTWYNTGTVKTTANSAVVMGTGTAWTNSGLRPGDMLLIGYNTVSPRSYEIKSIDNDTQITLIIAFPVAVTEAAYVGISMLSGDRTAITMTLAQQITKAFADNQAMQAVWQAFYSGSGTVTLTMPDGSTVTGSSFLKLTADMKGKANTTDLDKKADLVNGIVAVSQGGTGGATQTTAQQGLGLGSAATRDVGNSSSNLMQVGAFGIGAALSTGPLDYAGVATISPGLYYLNGGNFNNASPGNFGGLISFGTTDNGAQIYVANNGGQFAYRGLSNKTVYIVRSTQNTTVDGNGFIKQASPIYRLSNDQTDSVVSDDFTLSGSGAANPEAEGVEAKHLSTGVYTVTGSKGLSVDGWTVEVPQDVNGNRLIFVEIDVSEKGLITVNTFRRAFDTETAMIIAGEPMDIPAGRWIDLRLDMPEKTVVEMGTSTEEENNP